MIPYTQIRIYEDIGSEFVYDQELCDAINVELPEDATAEQVKEREYPKVCVNLQTDVR